MKLNASERRLLFPFLKATAPLPFREAINNFARNFKWSGFTFQNTENEQKRGIPAPRIQTSTAGLFLVPAFVGQQAPVSFPAILKPCSFLILQSP